MSSNSDWPILDVHTIQLPTIVTSSDLFDGELFGDELIDIYNTSVDNIDVCENEIPMLQNQTAMELHKSERDHADDILASMEVDCFHHGFQTSNSFNDLTSLLNSVSVPSSGHLDHLSAGTTASSIETNKVMVVVAPTTTSTNTVDQTGVDIAANNMLVPQATFSSDGIPSSSEFAATTIVTTVAASSKTDTTSSSTSKKRPAEKDSKQTSLPQAKKKATRRCSTAKKSTLPSTFTPPSMVSIVTLPNASMSLATSVASTNGLSKKTSLVIKTETPNPLSLGYSGNVASTGPITQSKVVISKTGGVTHNVKVVVEDVNRPVVSIAPTSAAAIIPSSDDIAKVVDKKNPVQSQVSDSISITGGSSSTENVLECGSSFNFKVDTSTAHIKALTGNNWVAACSGDGGDGGNETASPTHTPDFDSKSVSSDADNVGIVSGNNNTNVNRCKRQNLTADERARQNRDRNREHARNTRLRKKAYVEELKHTLTELVSQRDASEIEKRQAADQEKEQRDVRFRVIEEFLMLRGRNETNVARWSAILEDGVTFSVPSVDVTNLQSISRSDFAQTTLAGVPSVMAESNNFSTLLQTLCPQGCKFQYSYDRSDFFMDGCTGILEWSGCSIDATTKKLNHDGITQKGMIRATFSPASNKIVAAKLMFDSGSILANAHKQLKSTALLVPNPDTMYGSSSEFFCYEHVTAAQAAANQADALLDSIQMPCLSVVPVPSAVTVVHDTSSSSSSSSASSSEEFGDKSGMESDESISEPTNIRKGMTTANSISGGSASRLHVVQME